MTDEIKVPKVSLLESFKLTPKQMAQEEIRKAKHDALIKAGFNVPLRSVNRLTEIKHAEDIGVRPEAIKLGLMTDSQVKRAEELTEQ